MNNGSHGKGGTDMRAKKVRLTIPRRTNIGIPPKVEIVGHTEMPLVEATLLRMLARIHKEGVDEAHGIAGTSEEQGAAS